MLHAVVSSKIPLVEEQKRKEEPWVSRTNWHKLLAPGKALVQTLRGDVITHDFVSCDYITKPPEDLLDPENSQHPMHDRRAA
jgi:hypothetical protein